MVIPTYIGNAGVDFSHCAIERQFRKNLRGRSGSASVVGVAFAKGAVRVSSSVRIRPEAVIHHSRKQALFFKQMQDPVEHMELLVVQDGSCPAVGMVG